MTLHPDNEATRELAAGVISNGGLIAFRTDTFYGLGADPFNAAAVERVRELKERDDHKPILLLLADASVADRYVSERSKAFAELAAKFWPGPLTIVGFAVADLPREITAGTGTVGVRVPADNEVRELVRLCGGALTATSANPSRRDPARTAKDVIDYFGEAIDLVIDSGAVTATEPSTVVDVTGESLRVVRQGSIRISELSS